jgi:hypothetical protein
MMMLQSLLSRQRQGQRQGQRQCCSCTRRHSPLLWLYFLLPPWHFCTGESEWSRCDATYLMDRSVLRTFRLSNHHQQSVSSQLVSLLGVVTDPENQ